MVKIAMIKFNDEYVKKIFNSHGNEGERWLLSVDNTLIKYKHQLKLRNIELSKNIATNIIFNAYSELYGDVIIKLIFSPEIFFNEINFINNCKSRYMVKCFYYNLEDRIMVLEKIKPGFPLSTIENRSDRIKIFADIMASISMPEKDENLYRSYYNSFIRKISNKNIISKANKNIKEKIKESLKLYKEIDKMNLPKFVLHRDLHHNNILKFEDSWKVIDPQGVIGYSFFEATQFIKSEMLIDNNDTSKIKDIVENVANFINIDKKLIYIALYIDTVEKILYYLSIGASKEIINYNIKICDQTMKMLK